MGSHFSQRRKMWLSILSAAGIGLVGCADTDVGDETTRGTSTETGTEAEPLAQQFDPAFPRTTQDLPVTVRGTGKATIRLVTVDNPKAPAQAVTILDVHGLGNTGRVFDPLTYALYNDESQGVRVKRVITLDMIGHGGSSLPTNLPRGVNFGALTVDDNVDVLRQVIEALRAQSSAPQFLVGHSAGALTIAALQEKLLAQGSSLQKLGVVIALFIAPIPSTGRPWTPPSSSEVNKITPYVKVETNGRGIFIDLPPAQWLQASFTDRTGALATNAPTVAQITAAGYTAIEPIMTAAQVYELVYPGVPTIKRPSIRAGAFAAANGTRVAVVGFAQDLLVNPSDARDFYRHLSGDATDKSFLTIDFPDAVHNMTIVNPSRVITAQKVLFP
ncbi:MAG: alpha/beta fold hydrolase [Polyangiales bacterium]